MKLLPRLRPGPDADPAGHAGDRGSITPLVIGMFVCLLILTAGVTAAGSAFLAGQRLQRLCDGAIAAAVGAVDPSRSSASGVQVSDPIAAANQYLGVRGPDVGAVVTVGVDTISAQCTNQAPITFGALFGTPTLTRTVTATSQPIRRTNALGPTPNPAPAPQAGSEGTTI
ncbi:MAG TPA: pilus assembly protein TadG-related protein [Mycobacterium sp.]